MGKPELGHHLEICFSVDNMQESVEFYKNLGFEIYSGDPEKGWCTVRRGSTYFGLFADNFIDEEFGVPILMNFRGGNIDKLAELVDGNGVDKEKFKPLGNGTGSFIIEDPNGIKIFMDTDPEEERVDI